MFDAATGVFAANKVIRELGESGRIGSTETARTVILAETPLNMGENMFELSSPLVAGVTYNVNINGTVYPCVAYSGEFGQLGASIAIGNETLLGEADLTKEPFFAANIGVDDRFACVCASYTEGTISITAVVETIHPIDPKFLPGVCLPVVEITSAEYPQSGTVALSAEESAALTAAASMNVGAVIRYTLQTIPMTIVAQSLMGTMFVDAINNPAFQFKASDDGWIMGE